MPCGRFKRVRQAEVVSPEVNAFKRKLKLTILMTLVSEKQHAHPEVGTAESNSLVGIQGLARGDNAIPALGAGTSDSDAELLLDELRGHLAAPTPISRKRQ